MALGVIPELHIPSYCDLRNRREASWYSKEMAQFLSEKLYEDNIEYTFWKKEKINLETKFRHLAIRIKKRLIK